MRTLITGGSSDIGKEFIKLRMDSDEIAATRSQNCELQVNDRVIECFQQDLGDTRLSDKLASWIEKGVDHIVLNANTNNFSFDKMHLYDLDEVSQHIQKNIVGNMRVLQKVLPMMMKNNYGRVVFVSSMTVHGGSGYTAYSASKAAMEAIIKTISTDYSKYGITANIVRPGIVKTQRTKRFWGLSSFRKVVEPIIPMQRFAEAHEVAKAIDFFCKSESYCSGSVLEVAGGLPQINMESLFKIGN